MDDHIDAFHRSRQPLLVANVANEVAHDPFVLGERFGELHLVLLELVAAVHDDLRGCEPLEHRGDESLAE